MARKRSGKIGTATHFLGLTSKELADRRWRKKRDRIACRLYRENPARGMLDCEREADRRMNGDGSKPRKHKRQRGEPRICAACKARYEYPVFRSEPKRKRFTRHCPACGKPCGVLSTYRCQEHHEDTPGLQRPGGASAPKAERG